MEIPKNYKKYISRQFIVYSVIGFSGVFIDYIIYLILVYGFDVNYQLANWISTSCGITNNFFLNAYLNFKTTNRLLLRFLKFYGVGLLGLAVTAALLYILVALFGVSAFIAKGLTIFVVVILQYSLNKKFSFGR